MLFKSFWRNFFVSSPMFSGCNGVKLALFGRRNRNGSETHSEKSSVHFWTGFPLSKSPISIKPCFASINFIHFRYVELSEYHIYYTYNRLRDRSYLIAAKKNLGNCSIINKNSNIKSKIGNIHQRFGTQGNWI